MNLDDLKREANASLPWDTQLIHGVIDHLHAQGRILPDGFVAVPLEPTERICNIMADAIANAPDAEQMSEEMEYAYKAMIAAAYMLGIKKHDAPLVDTQPGGVV